MNFKIKKQLRKIDDIKGMIINQFQAVELIKLIGIKIK